MRHTVKIHEPQPTTHLPRHEQNARRRRAKASLPIAPKPTERATHPPTPAAPTLSDAHEADVTAA